MKLSNNDMKTSSGAATSPAQTLAEVAVTKNSDAPGQMRGLRCIIPLIHFAASFFYERLIFIFGCDYSIVAAKPLNDSISDRFEYYVTYAITKVLAAIMIWYFWKALFALKDCIAKKSPAAGEAVKGSTATGEEVKGSTAVGEAVIKSGGISLSDCQMRKNAKILVLFFIIGCILGAFMIPETFFHSEDNLITYSYAIRFAPEYWHSIYSSCVYAALMMVIPHPFAIGLLQWMGFIGVCGYVVYRAQRSPVIKGRGKWFVLLAFAVPYTYLCVTDAYRTEQYAILAMQFVAWIAFDIVDSKARNSIDLVKLCILAAFLAVWRSEGIVLGVLGFIAALIMVYKVSLKRFVCYSCLLVLLFVGIGKPQKMGDKKYYGNDYSFINSFCALTNICASSDANLSYDGADADLAAIDAVVPIELLKGHGLDGYRRYNVSCGRKDINQSMATESVGAAYKKAYRNLLIHNIPIYVKTQAGLFLNSVGLLKWPYVVKYETPAGYMLPEWTYDAWDKGREDYLSVPTVRAWYENDFRLAIGGKLSALPARAVDIFVKIYATAGVFAILSALAVWIALSEFVKAVKTKKLPGFLGLSIVLLGQFMAIVLVMPAAALAYFHAYLYCTFVLDGIWIISRKRT